MQKFQSHFNLQNFVSTHIFNYSHFDVERNKINRARLKMNRPKANVCSNHFLTA
ncbi:hypothetical protein ROA7450_00266 [Roseovarius albus]|uniref:Uncharacterized protein n=1 Tax=Roseovarius albus TaxID=1247867 RepID=A0A1X6YBA8_9RHOB|nr:hypothetical protein ROA7450_00266 [Roseovarius albus]